MRLRQRFARYCSPFAWLLALCLSCGVVACKSLPDVEPEAPAKATPTIATTKGTLPPKQASALAARRWANASGNLKALAAPARPGVFVHSAGYARYFGVLFNGPCGHMDST